MNTNQELSGSTVLVHPELSNDPANKPGQVGKIERADVDQDDFHVRFADGKMGLYSADALLVLEKPEVIYNYLELHSPNLNWKDYKDLFNIALIQQHGYPEQLPTAFEIAGKTPSTIANGTRSLESALELKTTQSRGR